MSVSVCLSVCLSLRDQSSELHVRSSSSFLCMLSVARSSSGSVVIRYVLPILWMTSCLLISQVARRRRPAEAQCTRSLGLGYKLCAVIPVASQRTHGSTFRKLKVTSQVATPGAESAVYDCFVFAFRNLLLWANYDIIWCNYLNCTECPADWTYIESVNGCYKLVNRNWNWDGAGIECRSLRTDAHLLLINNAEEQHAITKMLDSVNGWCPYDWFILSPLRGKLPPNLPHFHLRPPAVAPPRCVETKLNAGGER